MKKEVKICPVCNCRNSLQDMFCQNPKCKNALYGVSVSWVSDTEGCNAECNKTEKSKVLEQEYAKGPIWRLRTYNRELMAIETRFSGVIGRGDGCILNEYLKNCQNVAQKHCKLFELQGQLYIVSLYSEAPVYINDFDFSISPGKRFYLRKGDIIRLGTAGNRDNDAKLLVDRC